MVKVITVLISLDLFLELHTFNLFDFIFLFTCTAVNELQLFMSSSNRNLGIHALQPPAGEDFPLLLPPPLASPEMTLLYSAACWSGTS